MHVPVEEKDGGDYVEWCPLKLKPCDVKYIACDFIDVINQDNDFCAYRIRRKLEPL